MHDLTPERSAVLAGVEEFATRHAHWAFVGFGHSPHGIHFTLGDPHEMDDPERLAQAYVRAVNLFRATFAAEDEGFALFQGIYKKAHLQQISDYGSAPFVTDGPLWDGWPVVDDPHEQRAAMLLRPRQQLNYEKLCLDHVGNDMNLTDARGSSTFIINNTSPSVFQLCDDRELLILAEDPEVIRRLHSEFADWVCAECLAEMKTAWDRKT